MSVEDLVGRSVDEFRSAQSIIAKTLQKEKEQGHEKSPVYIVSSAFINEGQEKLKEISGKLRRSGINMNFGSRVPILNQLPPQDQESATLSYAAIILGVTMIALEQTLAEKMFSPKDMIDRFKFSLENTFIPMPRWDPSSLGMVELIPKRHRELLALADRDRSLAILLTKGIDKIPSGIKTFLTDTNALNWIKTVLLLPYQEKVNGLVTENAIRMSQG